MMSEKQPYLLSLLLLLSIAAIAVHLFTGLHINSFSLDDIFMWKAAEKSIFLMYRHTWRPLERVVYRLDDLLIFNLWFIINISSLVTAAIYASKTIGLFQRSMTNRVVVALTILSPLTIYALYQSDHVSQNLAVMFTTLSIYYALISRYNVVMFASFLALLSKETSLGLILILPIFLMLFDGRKELAAWRSVLLPVVVYLVIRLIIVPQGTFVDPGTSGGRYELDMDRVFPNIALTFGSLVLQIYPGEMLAGRLRLIDLSVGIASLSLILLAGYRLFKDRERIDKRRILALVLLCIASTMPHFLGKVSELYVQQSIIPFVLLISLSIQDSVKNSLTVIAMFVLVGLVPFAERLILLKNNSDDIASVINGGRTITSFRNTESYAPYSYYVIEPDIFIRQTDALRKYPVLRKGAAGNP